MRDKIRLTIFRILFYARAMRIFRIQLADSESALRPPERPA
jgi:hypothetical protein